MWKMLDAAKRATPDDDDVQEALRAGDNRRALTLLMSRYGDEVYRFAYVMTAADHLAEEVRQQVFVEVYRDLASYKGSSSLRAWLLGITRHRSLDITKKQKRWANRFKNTAPDDEEADNHEPDRELDRSRLAKILTACLGKLAPAARDAVVLRYHKDLSYDEAAELAGDKAGTLQQRVARALPALRKCVDARMHTGGAR